MKDSLLCPDCEGIISIDEYLNNECRVCKNKLDEVYKCEKVEKKDISKTFLKKLYHQERESVRN